MAAIGVFQIGMMSCLLPTLFFMLTDAVMRPRTRATQCELIKEPLCQGNYNYTRMPNILGHETHEEASRRLQEFGPLIDSECSPQLKFFLCSLHFPMCTPFVPVGITACRAMCERVRSKCEPYLEVFSFKWPESIDCSKLREHTETIKQCLYPDEGAEDADNSDQKDETVVDDDVITDDVTTDDVTDVEPNDRRKQGGRRKKKPGKGREPKVDQKEKRAEPDGEKEKQQQSQPDHKVALEEQKNEKKQQGEEQVVEVPRKTQGNDPPHKGKWSPVDTIYQESDPGPDYSERDFDYPDNTDYDVELPSQFLPPETDTAPLKCENPDKFVYVEKMKKCLPICNENTDVLFSSTDKLFAYYWMLGCAVLCIVSSALTVGTFLVDSKRFRYPERPIIFLSLCYMLYSSAYLVRLGRGPTGSVSCVTNDDSDVTYIVTGDLESTGCSAVFFLLYYFGMAAAVWWVILSVTWFLAAGLKWGHEAIEAHGFYFHLVAWMLPAVQTIVVLVMGKVDGDELTGLCYVGNFDPESLLYFVIVPLTSYLAIGALALGCGFGSLFKIRRVILRKSGEKDAGKLEKLMLKIGIFTVLYIVPTACVVAVHVYQYRHHAEWVEKAETWTCNPPGFTKYSAKFARVNRHIPENALQPESGYPFSGAYYGDGAYWGGVRYPEFYFGSHAPQYVLPEPADGPYAANSGLYGRPQYPVKRVETGYDYKTGSFQENPEKTENGDESPPEGYGPFYTGNQLVRVPHSLNRGYPRRPPRFRPMAYYPEMARALRHYAEMIGVTSSDTDPGKIGAVTDPTETTRKTPDCHLPDSIPSFPIYVIKILMSLLAGITSGIWVWSGKTYKSWKIFCCSSCCRRRDKDKGTVVTSNTPHATSTGNVNAAPSVTSQLLPKAHNRQTTDEEHSRNPLINSNNRFSYPILSSTERYDGYQPVRQDENRNNTPYYSTLEHQGSLTLGDIAREYSKNVEEELQGNQDTQRCHQIEDELRHAPNKTYVVTSQTRNHNANNGHSRPIHQSMTDAEKTKRNSRNQKRKKKELNCLKSERKTYGHAANNSKHRAIPNPYEDAPSHHGRQNQRQVIGSVQNCNGNHFKNPERFQIADKRARKISEGDINKLSLVSQGGFSPVSTSTRKKAVSLNVGTITSV